MSTQTATLPKKKITGIRGAQQQKKHNGYVCVHEQNSLRTNLQKNIWGLVAAEDRQKLSRYVTHWWKVNKNLLNRPILKYSSKNKAQQATQKRLLETVPREGYEPWRECTKHCKKFNNCSSRNQDMVVRRLVEHYTVHISDDQADNWQLHANIMAISALGNKTNTPAFCFLSGNFKKKKQRP